MKKLYSIYLITLLLTALTSCQKDLKDEYKYDAVTPELKVSVGKLDFEGHGGSQNINITSNTFWNAFSYEDWLHISMEEGRGSKSINITTDPNPSTREDRTGTVTIKNGLQTCQVDVTQAMTPEILEVSPTSVSCDAKEGYYYVEVTSNVDSWSVSSNENWCSVSPISDITFQIYVKLNSSYSSRTANVTVKGLDKSLTVRVDQNAAAMPTFSNISESGVTNTEATINFKFNSSDIQVKRYGVCYSQYDTEPTIDNSTYVDRYLSSYNSTVSCTIYNLTMDTGYYYRCFVETDAGITYSNATYFKTLAIIAPEENDNKTPNF